MKIHQLGIDEALASLHSGPEGLSTPEAERRLREFGPNRVERLQGTPLTVRFLKGFTHFFAVILWVAATLAFVAAHYDPGTGMLTLGFAIIGVILVNGLFSFWQEYRAERTLAALQRMLPNRVKAQRDNTVIQLTAHELVPGDVILLEAGDDVPADCRLIEAYGVRVNNATVTGESAPLARDTEPSDAEDMNNGGNILLAGTSMVTGEARALVFATGMRTVFGGIAHLCQIPVQPLSPLQREIVHLSRIVALLATGLGGVFFLIGQWLGVSFWQNFIFAIGIIVANVPEGLLPTVTLSLAMASQRMARRNALIRHLPAVETLGCASVICTDKTGTLTTNHMTAHTLYASNMYHAADDSTALRTLCAAQPPLFAAALLCNDVQKSSVNGHTTLLGDPMEVALVEMARAADCHATGERRDEIPFDSTRKRLTTVHATVQGTLLYCKGALEALLPLCSFVQDDGPPQALTETRRAEYLQAQERLAHQGLRVLAFAWRALPDDCALDQWEHELILTGLVGLEDPPRPEVPDAIAKCHQAGIKVIMVTGDLPHTAEAVARQIGLLRTERPRIVTGAQLQRLSVIQLQLALDAPEILFARVAADQKLRIVQALQAKKQIVALTGDGVNDAPALRAADIGIAMGITGTDVAREAADMILLDDNFASIVAAVEEGRNVFQNLRKFLTYILTSNIPEVVPYLAFVLLRIPLPLTVLQILAVDLGTDILPALALGAEKPHHTVMQQPPRQRSERLLNAALLARAYGFLGLIEAAAAMAAYFFVLETGGWNYGEELDAADPLYLQATTACLGAIIVMQMVNVWLCRSPTESAFKSGLFSNPVILAGLLLELLLLAVLAYTPFGQKIFGTAALDGAVWWFIAPFAVGMLLLEEVRKAWVRSR